MFPSFCLLLLSNVLILLLGCYFFGQYFTQLWVCSLSVLLLFKIWSMIRKLCFKGSQCGRLVWFILESSGSSWALKMTGIWICSRVGAWMWHVWLAARWFPWKEKNKTTWRLKWSPSTSLFWPPVSLALSVLELRPSFKVSNLCYSLWPQVLWNTLFPCLGLSSLALPLPPLFLFHSQKSTV